MKRLVLVPLALFLVAALVPAAAFAKGASEATIEGPGLDNPISLAGEGQPGGEALMQLAENAGFFAAVFGQTPDPMLSERPSGNLGPRYTITYVMPGPVGEDRLSQDLYPYATLGPVSYMAPGQPFFGTERTRGGWYVAAPALKDSLVAAGLPESPPTGGGDSRFPWTVVGVVAAASLVVVLAAVAALVIKLRAGPATA